MSCRCETPLRSSNPRRRDCNRCGKVIEERAPAPIVHHCARCLEELLPGHTGALLYQMDGGVALHMVRFCASCSKSVFELAVNR